MRSIRLLMVSVAVLALIVIAAPHAHAVVTISPPVSSGDFQVPMCSVLNTGTSPINVSVEWRDASGGLFTAVSNACNGTPLQGGALCNVIVNGVTTFQGYCKITSASTHIRASVWILAPSSGTVAIIPVK
jgi:hypothetical protein